MHIVISGQHLEVGESLQNHAKSLLEKNVKKFFPAAIGAKVTIAKKNTSHFHTHIALNDCTTGHMNINSNGEDFDAYKSVEIAVKKLEKQLEKYKDRIKNHHKSKYYDIPAVKYLLEEASLNSAEATAPTIVSERPMQIKVLSVKDAVMHMDLQDLQAMIFINASNYKLSLVYNRKDGNIAWVDSNLDLADKVTKLEGES
jgi:ribosomal subunit interface protein